LKSNKIYQWNPEEYASNSSAQKGWGDDFLKNLTFNQSDKILDLGCGDGIITSGLAEKVSAGYIVGLDISSEMIRYASSRFPVSDYKNISFIHGNSLLLPFKTGFDIVFSNSSFHWISDHQTLLAEIYQVLLPHGRLLVQMGGKGNMGAIIDATDRVMSRPEWSQYFNGFTLPFTFFDPDEYRPILIRAGFSIKRLELIKRTMVQKGKEGLTSSVRSVWHPFMEKVPLHLQEIFLSQVIEIIIEEHPPDENGDINIPMFRLEIEASIK
jgi:trans-aconitate 2-methyltransferase